MVDENLPRSDFYVYVIFRPNGVPCYVGKGCGKRWKEHFSRPFNPHLANIINSADGDLPRIKVREGLTEKEAFQTERAFIAAIGRKVHGGPLTNMTDGGDGFCGGRHSNEWKLELSRRGRGYKHTEQSKANMKAAQIACCDGKQPLRLSQKGKKRSPEFRQKMSETAKRFNLKPPSRCGAINTQESNEKRAAKMRAYWASAHKAKECDDDGTRSSGGNTGR